MNNKEIVKNLHVVAQRCFDGAMETKDSNSEIYKIFWNQYQAVENAIIIVEEYDNLLKQMKM